jgi:hypothetical protein
MDELGGKLRWGNAILSFRADVGGHDQWDGVPVYASLLWYDPEVDGYQPPNRYLVPRLNRWLSPDPAGEKVVELDDPQT